jgi:dTDP-glucose 4,6-dehydratase
LIFLVKELIILNLLITGGAGFIGSNFLHYYLKKYPDDQLVNLDLLTYAGNIANLTDIVANSHYTFVQGNIINRQLVSHFMQMYNIDTVVNFAAESHVDRSIIHPEAFVETNVQGTLALLEAARHAQVHKFIQISTDEVYGSLGTTGYFNETSLVQPNSPYAASKAAADLLVRSYYKTYGMNVNITRCSNNFGPYQFPEKLIPLLVSNGMDGKPLPIYGDGQNIRDWLYVADHCHAIDLVLHAGKPGEIYNIGGHHEQTNNQIAKVIVAQLDLPKTQIKYVADRLGHDQRYAIDATKIETELGWQATVPFEQGLKQTIRWYQTHEAWWRPLKQRTILK